MDRKKKFFILILIMGGCLIIGFICILDRSMLQSGEHCFNHVLAHEEEIKTDIAQVFIDTSQTVSSDKYSAARLVITDAKNGACKTVIDSNAKIKIRGNSTSVLKKLPYNIKLSSSQGVLGMSKGKKWCLLANYMDTSLLRNKLAYDFAENIGMEYSCESRYADVWLNGEYQGNYLITVPVEAGKNRVDIDTSQNEYLLELETYRIEENKTYIQTGMSRLVVNAPETLSEVQTQWLSTFFQEAEKAMQSNDYAQITQYVDVDSFINFYITQELFKNLDVHTSSSRFYIKNNRLYAGPLWDCDLSSGNVALYPGYFYYLLYNNHGGYGNSSENSYEGFWALNSGPWQNYYATWIGNLCKCNEFKSRLCERYEALQAQIVNLYKDNEKGKNQIDTLLNQYGSSFARDNKLWPVSLYRDTELYRTNEKTFDESISYLRSWLKNRNEWLLKALKEE